MYLPRGNVFIFVSLLYSAHAELQLKCVNTEADRNVYFGGFKYRLRHIGYEIFRLILFRTGGNDRILLKHTETLTCLNYTHLPGLTH